MNDKTPILVILSALILVNFVVLGVQIFGIVNMLNPQKEIVQESVADEQVQTTGSEGAQGTETVEDGARFETKSLDIAVMDDSIVEPVINRGLAYDKEAAGPILNIEPFEVISSQIGQGIHLITTEEQQLDKATGALNVTNLMEIEMARNFVRDITPLFDEGGWSMAYGSYDDSNYEANGSLEYMLIVEPEASADMAKMLVFTINADSILDYRVY